MKMTKKIFFSGVALTFACTVTFAQQNSQGGTQNAAPESSSNAQVSGQSDSGENQTSATQAESSPNQQKEKSSSSESSSTSSGEKISFSKAGESDVPSSKRPKTPDSSKVTDLDNTDPDGREKNADILKFGLESEISDLLDKMISQKDVRFVNEAYDLYNDSKNVDIKNKVMLFFQTLEDPCLEDFAVIVLNDPYDENISTVNACFSYVQTVKTTCAIPAIENLLESENAEYFTGAVSALGKLGGSDEARYLTEYYEKQELTIPQKQTIVRVLGELKAVETYDKMVELAQDENENAFVRMYAAEAIGAMQKSDAVDVLTELYGEKDPNLRTYVIKGLSYFTTSDAQKVILQAVRDDHWKVRKEAIDTIKKQKMTSAVSYLVYRAKNDPERTIKNQCYAVLAELNTSEGNEYLVKQITEKKVSDDTRSRVAAALLENGSTGMNEILALAEETLKDDRRKSLRYALGKEFAKYNNSAFADITLKYLQHKDVSTIGTGLDMYAKGRYSNCDSFVKDLASQADPEAKKRNAMAFKAAKILGIDPEKNKKTSTAADAK
ncbi:HEAT repeat domain-containing protein [Treponema zioleckii]|uniref:HEAT repeat domain-containing protein n=1 Tax=Treponema zioleckii TaxID=331680 RepID=UPI00168AE6CD|nr:HEAT repeat domain-containing protein [Treponema zioleckii]